MIDDHPQTVTYTVRRNIMNLLSYETLKEIEYPGFSWNMPRKRSCSSEKAIFCGLCRVFY